MIITCLCDIKPFKLTIVNKTSRIITAVIFVYTHFARITIIWKVSVLNKCKLYINKILFCALKIFLSIKRIFCFCRLVLRIATDDSKAVCRLSVKFGATLKSSRLLLERAKELGLDVIGVSFHVGSGCTDPETYSQAISDARYVFDMGVSGLVL